MVTNRIEYGLELFAEALFKKQLGFSRRGLTRRDQPDSILSFRIYNEDYLAIQDRQHSPAIFRLRMSLVPVIDRWTLKSAPYVREIQAVFAENPGAFRLVPLEFQSDSPLSGASTCLHCMTLGPLRSRGPLSGRMPRRRATSW